MSVLDRTSAVELLVLLLSIISSACNAMLPNGQAIEFATSEVEAEVSMCEDFISEIELKKFETATTEAIHNVNSLDELASWLQSQRCVDFVRLEEYVIKTFPPRREFTIGMRMEGGIIREKVLAIVILDDDQFEFREMREPN